MSRDRVQFVRSANLYRRNFTKEQRDLILMHTSMSDLKNSITTR